MTPAGIWTALLEDGTGFGLVVLEHMGVRVDDLQPMDLGLRTAFLNGHAGAGHFPRRDRRRRDRLHYRDRTESAGVESVSVRTLAAALAGMLAEQVAGDYLDIYLSVEEAEALADAAESAETPDKRKAAVVKQAAGQIRLLVGEVREARRRAETNIERRAGLRRGF